MTLRPVVIEEFPGIDLRTDPGNSKGALDLLNVSLDLPGQVRTRDGTSLVFTDPVGATSQHFHFAQTFNLATPHVIVANGLGTANLYAINPSGTSVGTTTIATSTSAGMSGVAIGTPTATYFYVTTNGATVVKRWDGTTWTAPATFPATGIRALSLSPTDNRIVACQAGGKVSFSDPGTETFGANNFVLLTPGDGEEIQAAAVFNNQSFVFKQTKFFVFYGNSTDSTGSPIFNYRVVDTGVGIHPVSQATRPGNTQALCVGPEGIYFYAHDGIYRTTGGAPTKVSGALDPYFAENITSPFYQGVVPTPLNSNGVRMLWLQEHVYVSIMEALTPTGSTWVLNLRTGAWVRWSIYASGLAWIPKTTTAGDVRVPAIAPAGATGGTATLRRLDSTVATDAGSAIVSRYRLPFETYGDPREKRIRETFLEGTGTPTVQWSDDWGSLATGSAVTLGTSPAVAVGRQRLAQRGRAFSLQLGASSGAWAVNRVQVNVHSELRPAAVTV